MTYLNENWRKYTPFIWGDKAERTLLLNMEFTKAAWAEEDLIWMRRCLALAEKAKQGVRSNPMVGCVLVSDGRLLAEGFHRKFGGNHAEVEAWKQAGSPTTLEGCTVYVSLEPCTHQGKTPPCTDLLIQLRPKRVVVASVDPDVRVAGSGLKKLAEAGIAVECGCLDAENKYLNRHFFTQRQQQRPFITLKWAETSQGMVGRTDGSPNSRLMISGQTALVYGHMLRAQHELILVGGNTILCDDPQLNVRFSSGPSPRPVVWWTRPAPEAPFRFRAHPDALEIQHSDFEEVWSILRQQAGNSVLVEGGPTTQQAFIDLNRWDEIHRIVHHPHLSGGDLPAPLLPSNAKLIKAIPLGNDTVFVYQPQKHQL